MSSNSTAVARRTPATLSNQDRSVSIQDMYRKEQVDIIRETVAKDANDLELHWFLTVAKQVQLDPLRKQIYFIKRSGRPTMQTSIDGLRSIAHRTGSYAGMDEIKYDNGYSHAQLVMEGASQPLVATATVYKFVQGHRVSFTASAGWAEYYPGRGTQSTMWDKMPFGQLGKCAEAKALRMAFPEDLGGLYTDDEMQQAPMADADAEIIEAPPAKSVTQSVTEKLAKKASKAKAEPREPVQENTIEEAVVIEDDKPEPEPEPAPSTEELISPEQYRELNIACSAAELKDPVRLPAISRMLWKEVRSTKDLTPDDYEKALDVLQAAKKLKMRGKDRLEAAWKRIVKENVLITADSLSDVYKDLQEAERDGKEG